MPSTMSLRLGMAGVAAAVLMSQGAFAQETPKRGGVFRHAVESESNTYDCHATATSFSLQVLAPHYDTLLRFDPMDYTKVIGGLAESWEQSDDGLKYTFKLHQGVKFHDGSDFDSKDIQATFDRIRKPPEGIVSSRQGQWQNIDTIETPDANTVVFTLKNPNPAQELLFANPWNCVYSAEKLAENPNYPATEVMGTGPFVFVENIKGSTWTAKRNENYFIKDKPYLDGIEVNFIGGPGIINALAGNQVDAALFSVVGADQDKLKALNPDIVFQNGPFTITNFITFNMTKAPFNDPKVRKALNMAISRAEGEQVLPKISPLTGHGSILFPRGSIADRTPEEIEKLPGMSNDIEAQRAEAKKLLEEAGVAGMKFTLVNRTIRQPWEPLGLFFLDQWRKAGLNVDQVALETPQYFAALQSKNFDVAIDFNNTVSVDPNEVLVKFLPGSPNNYSGLEDPKIREMFQAQIKATGDERAKIVKQIEEYYLDNGYVIPGFESKRGVALHKDVKGWKLPSSTVLNLQLDTVWLDR
ncbi:MAG: ABC transporter substrate-binding protein [Rhizobiaceae bacterium]|nr:ABC transporter substrate-binding protein [Rhizobiaceae bacterium]